MFKIRKYLFLYLISDLFSGIVILKECRNVQNLSMGKMADRKEVMGNMLESENHDSAIKKPFVLQTLEERRPPKSVLPTLLTHCQRIKRLKFWKIETKCNLSLRHIIPCYLFGIKLIQLGTLCEFLSDQESVEVSWALSRKCEERRKISVIVVAGGNSRKVPYINLISREEEKMLQRKALMLQCICYNFMQQLENLIISHASLPFGSCCL